MASTQSASSISLKGSVEHIVEYFHYAINSILYQRGIYPPESFIRKENYGLVVLMSNDNSLQKYFSNVLEQVRNWLLAGKVHRLVLVIANMDSKETLERWDFNITCEKDASGAVVTQGSKPVKKIQEEIREIIRQITASVTFLPMLDEPCSFDLLIYTDREMDIPESWGENGPCLINNSQEVKLRSFSTSVHKVETAVSYKFVEY